MENTKTINNSEVFKSDIKHLLYMMYVDKYATENIDYDLVDEFYGYLGYDLESQDVLYKLGVQGTSDLEELLNTDKI